MKTCCFISLISTVLFALTSHAEVKTVEHVDLVRYVGRWYEIAAIPQSFQKKCVSNVTANYTSLSNGLIEVQNSCMKSDGGITVAEGRAKVTDPKTNAKLKVTFVKLFKWIFSFGGDYWIIDLEKNYRYAVVGHPTRKYGWILSRDPVLSREDLVHISAGLKSQGYNTCDFLTTIQTGGITQRASLCKYLMTE